jgi:glucose-1-phosphate cytidylyltransferase
MQTVILCGGKGSRIGRETQIRPKPLINVGDKPILWHIMKSYYHHGHDDFILCLGYKGEMIKQWFMEPDWMHYDFELQRTREWNVAERIPRWKVTFADTGENSDTGERVRRIADYIEDKFFLTYGDGVANVDINRLLACHNASGRLATITTVYPVSRFGNVSIVDGRVAEFSEKTVRDEAVNGGFMVFEREALDYFKPGCNLERDVLAALVRDGQLNAYEHRGYWQCMDTAKEVEMLNREYEHGKCPWVVW